MLDRILQKLSGKTSAPELGTWLRYECQHCGEVALCSSHNLLGFSRRARISHCKACGKELPHPSVVMGF